MPRLLDRPTTPSPATQPRPARRVTPSIVAPDVIDDYAAIDGYTAEPFTLEQELKPFGAWVGAPVWVPPKDAGRELADTMLRHTRPFASADARWAAVLKHHRADFTQVREIDLFQASIRLPQGRFFVTVTEQKNFDQITDAIPACVQTRLDEFLAGPEMERGAKVYYLKPLCVEIGDELILTTRDDLHAAIAQVRQDVFAEYRRRALYRRPLAALASAANLALAAPRALVRGAVARKQKAIAALEAHLEFERRKLALRTAKAYTQLRSTGCTFDDVLELTNPLKRTDVIEQYCTEHELSRAKRAQLLQIAAGNLPWFVAVSLAGGFLATNIVTALTITTPPVVVCDPAFVAELPGSRGTLHKIGHFDEVAGVMHVEI